MVKFPSQVFRLFMVTKSNKNEKKLTKASIWICLLLAAVQENERECNR